MTSRDWRALGAASFLGKRPNGSRLSCGRLARRRKGGGRQSVPTRAQHSDSLETINARQLQALVRPLPRLGAFGLEDPKHQPAASGLRWRAPFDTEDARSIEACDHVMRFEDLTQRSWPFNVLYGGSDFQVTHIRSHDNREPGQRRERLRNLRERGVLELDGNGRLGLSASKGGTDDQRSEEHTSELQSRENLVCRLLLEKKKKN